MSNGKIIWTAPQFWALILDGLHYLSLAHDPAFNPGTGDFGDDFIIRPDAAQADALGLICGKGAASLANNAGYHLFWDRDNACLVLKINDGQADPLTINGTPGSLPGGAWAWGAVRGDRDGLAQFYVNAAAAGSGFIAARAGSLNNTEAFKAGGLDAATSRFKGYLGLLRVDVGRALPGDWHVQEWNRLRFGLKRRPYQKGSLATWLFGQSLIDSLGGYALVYNPETDTPAYDTGYPSGEISYTFEHNFNLDFEFDELATDSQQRGADGAARNAAAPYEKLFFRGEFQYLGHAQKTAIRAAELSVKEHGGFDFYLRADHPRSMRCLAPEPTVFRQPLAYAHETPYSGEVYWEEV